MNIEPKDQTKRRQQIELLEAVIAKNAAAIAITEAQLKTQITKQINRLAELRCQKLLLGIAERSQTENPKS